MTTHDSSHQSHEQLHALIRQKEAAVQAKSRLIDNMAYQIRTLSNAVIGFSDLLLIEDLNEELTEYVNEIHQAGNGLSALVNEVLDWARLESGRLKISRTKCDLSRIIHDMEKVAATAAADRTVDYAIEVDPDLPSHILSDGERLLKCMINLIANAFKYSPDGIVCICVLPRQYQDSPCVQIDVVDSGVGISPEKLQHLFEPAQVEEDVSEEVLTMLDMGFTVTAGLPLTKQLIEVLGGTLEVSSRLNEGSTFSVILPVGLSDEETVKIESYQPQIQTQTLPEQEPEPTVPSILLVEDQPSNRTVISLMLETLGVEVQVAEDGLEGVEKASGEDTYDLILMDLKMPRMNGYEATEQIRANGIETPIVALSAKVLNENENHQIAAMFDDFLTKPVDSQKLLTTVKKFIATFQRDDQAASETAEADEVEVLTFEYGD